MDIYSEYVHLARIAVSGRQEDAAMLLQRTLRRSKKERPDFEEQLRSLLNKINTNKPDLTRAVTAKSVFNNNDESQSHLLTTKTNLLDFNPVWNIAVSSHLDEIILEQEKLEELYAYGVNPTKSILFTGPPGVGKTLAANWLAHKLNKNLVVLDLASIMSSYLGKTGSNLKKAIEEASISNNILFLDEFDAIAKHREDSADVGELRRLVNVLLQSLDSRENDSLLIAATNHPEMLDKAIWRRFDRIVEFPSPSASELKELIQGRFSRNNINIDNEMLDIITQALAGESYADVENWLSSVLRSFIIQKKDIEESLAEKLNSKTKNISANEKIKFANKLIANGISQRKASSILGISRDTIRRKTVK